MASIPFDIYAIIAQDIEYMRVFESTAGLNVALMKKGLRRRAASPKLSEIWFERSPDEKGIKTSRMYAIRREPSFERSPDEKGIEFCSSFFFSFVLYRRPDKPKAYQAYYADF
ncbi:MAG TPA: hypothetical protein ENK26_08705 [Gammaproteobacteria bacterium]|nr:hypothetical protein [Gammaproteobacteria bacterium]